MPNFYTFFNFVFWLFSFNFWFYFFFNLFRIFTCLFWNFNYISFFICESLFYGTFSFFLFCFICYILFIFFRWFFKFICFNFFIIIFLNSIQILFLKFLPSCFTIISLITTGISLKGYLIFNYFFSHSKTAYFRIASSIGFKFHTLNTIWIYWLYYKCTFFYYFLAYLLVYLLEFYF